jgi:hypothetical protein
MPDWDAHTSSRANGLLDFVKEGPPAQRGRPPLTKSGLGEHATAKGVSCNLCVVGFLRWRRRKTSMPDWDAHRSSRANGLLDFVREGPPAQRSRLPVTKSGLGEQATASGDSCNLCVVGFLRWRRRRTSMLDWDAHRSRAGAYSLFDLVTERPPAQRNRHPATRSRLGETGMVAVHMIRWHARPAVAGLVINTTIQREGWLQDSLI